MTEEMKMRDKMSHIKAEQRRVTRIVTRKFRRYYLTGGTALSFYFGHRFSEDLDFFTQGYRKGDPERIMDWVSKETGFGFKVEAEQDAPKLVPMKVYSLGIGRGCVLKIDFVRDFERNIRRIKGGLHSVEDIYVRKLIAAVGVQRKKDATGRIIAAGRWTGKDLFDVYYLSSHFRPVSEFFLEYFPPDRAESFIAWYRAFNRMELKLELLDVAPGVDAAEVLKNLDNEILKKLPDKLLG